MSQVRRVALLMGQDLGYCRGVLRGVHDYVVRTSRPWVFRDAPPRNEVLRALREWQAHGIIAHLFDRSFARRVIALRKPLVNTTSTLVDLAVPLVEVDHDRVGQLAGEYFLERGFAHFGYFGSSWTGFSKRRERGFRNVLEKAGYRVSSCYAEYLPRPPLETSWRKVDQRIQNWLIGLPKPAAILASNDVPARDLAEISRVLGFRVPEDLVLLGVDDDELECLLSSPPLSSVANPAERIGYEAAKLLDRLMSGGKPPEAPIIIPPGRVVTRQSTDIVAIDDPEVSGALAYIRRHAWERIGVADVVRALSVGRRDLERRFRKLLGRTPLEEIRRVRIESAKEYLSGTELPMSRVARLSGFSTPQRLAAVFLRATGMSPRAYRRQARPGEGPVAN